MKILDMPESVIKVFQRRKQITNKEISGVNEGCDWAIMTNGQKGLNVKYDAVYIKESPLTEEEQKIVETERKTREKYDLIEVCRPCSFNEVEERL